MAGDDGPPVSTQPFHLSRSGLPERLFSLEQNLNRPKRSTVLERPTTIAEFPVAMALINIVAARLANRLLQRHEALQVEAASSRNLDEGKRRQGCPMTRSNASEST